MDDRCVMCGRYVPEGVQVCNICTAEVESGAYKLKKSKKSLLQRLGETKAIYPALLIIFIIIVINIILINKRGI